MVTKGTLEKLTILSFEKADYSDKKPSGKFEAYVNPSEITLSYEIEYESANGTGTTSSRMNFKKAKPGDRALTFFLMERVRMVKKLRFKKKSMSFKR
jgi:hypothetical protein